jgi:hypothetical protein
MLGFPWQNWQNRRKPDGNEDEKDSERFKAKKYPMTLKRVRLNLALKRGDLTQFGYHHNVPLRRRRSALVKAIKRYGPLDILRKLNVLYVLNRRRRPTMAKTFRGDQRWISKHRALFGRYER